MTRNALDGISDSPDFQNFLGGGMPPGPPISFGIQYLFCSQLLPFSLVVPSWLLLFSYDGSFALLLGFQNSNICKIRVSELTYFLRARDSETLICYAEISRLV